MKGFSLLEVTIAIVILAGALIGISRIISSSYIYAAKIENIYKGTELAWIKLHEIDEDIKKNGIPEVGLVGKEEDGVFEDKAYEGFKWKYSIKKVYIPIPDLSAPSTGEESDTEKAGDMISGVKPLIEDFFKERIRKLTLIVSWGEGKMESEKVTFTIFLTTDGTTTEFKQGSGIPGSSTNKSSTPSKNTGKLPKGNDVPWDSGGGGSLDFNY